MNSQTETDDAPTCDSCGTTENVQELTLPDSDAVLGHECEDCLEESVEEINAEMDAEAEEAADAYEVEVAPENLSPTAAHVRRVVEETAKAFIRDHRGHGFHLDSGKVWNEGGYGDGYGVVFTLAFTDEEVRHAFFESSEDYYEDYPEGVESRLNEGYFEWIKGFAFELIRD